jgi:putative ABC transport system permease protein
MIPVKYNVRNLRVRWVTTVMTVVATGWVVFATVLTFGLADGLEHALRISGDPLDLIVLRKGSNEETSSSIDQSRAREIASLTGIAHDANGKPLCSAEFVTILTKPRRHNGGTTNLIVRGLQQEGRLLRPNFHIVQGRDIRTGVNEVITSQRMAERFHNLAIGEKLEINKVDFTVVGYFEAGGSAAESEVWTDLRDLTTARRQPEALSIVNLRADGPVSKEALTKRLRDDEQFKLNPLDEADYFERQMTSSIAIKFVGIVMALFLTTGAMFAAANTMYAAVASRSKEIGALRAIGFSRRSILVSFMFESVLLGFLGGVVGCLATLPFNGLSTGTANWSTFSEITFAFRFGPNVLLRGVLMSLAMGLIGGLFPAIRAVRMPIIQALRET